MFMIVLVLVPVSMSVLILVDTIRGLKFDTPQKARTRR